MFGKVPLAGLESVDRGIDLLKLEELKQRLLGEFHLPRV
jgi:hypothetical protein